MAAYYGEIVTDDDDSYYENEIAAPRRPRSRSRVLRVVDDKYSTSKRVKPVHGYSYDAASAIEREPEVFITNNLTVPGVARPRASSQGGSPAPNFVYVQAPREPSQTRIKNFPGKGKYRDDDDEMIDRLARLKFLEDKERREEQERMMKGYVDPATAERLARLKILEEESRKSSMSPELAERLARLKAMEERKAREDEQNAWASKIREDARREDERKERIALEYEEKARQRQRAEDEAVARAEASRARAEAEANATRDRLIASEREKAAAAAAKQKAETARILAEAKDKAAAEKAERELIMAEERLKIEREKREAAEERALIVAEERMKAEKEKREREDERRRILAEEEQRKKKEKAEWEETTARVLAEQKKQKEEAEAKKKAEDEAFKFKVKEQFMAVGYSPDYIEDILDKKDRKHSSSSTSRNGMAIQLARPTYIRVQIKHLLPETLNHYQLPWEFDPNDDKYILIKEYIDHDFQQVLFQHTKKILKKRDLLITDGYTKETVTTLRPNVYKVKDKESEETYLVRRKSTGKSPSRPHRNWMFT